MYMNTESKAAKSTQRKLFGLHTLISHLWLAGTYSVSEKRLQRLTCGAVIKLFSKCQASRKPTPGSKRQTWLTVAS